MKKAIAILTLLIAVSLPSFGQTLELKGVVTNSSKEPISGAAILVKGTTNGTLTDDDGNFSLMISDTGNTSLIVSFVGYHTREIQVGSKTQISIILESKSTELQDAVVIGYGTSTKKEFTGAGAQLEGRSIEKLNIARVDQSLQGQLAGVSISTNSGSPGGSANIRIRGLSTFDDNDPLILVDGVVYDSEGLNALNPNDIESVNVLKDATAGIYGVRAANGVILITTKSGKKNSTPRIELSAYRGVQQTSKKLNLLNATEYAVLKNEMFSNGNDDLPFPNTQLGTGTNWQDSVFSNAEILSYNLSISGGTDKTTYSIGGSYFSQDGIVGADKSNFTRLSGRVNLSSDLSSRLKLNSVFLFTKEERDLLPENHIGSVLYNTINAFPTSPIRDSSGNFTYLSEVNDIINPIAQMQNTYNTNYVNKFVGKEELVFALNKSIKITNRLNYNYALVDQKVFSPLVWYGTGKAQNTAANANLDPVQVEIAPGTKIDRGASVFEARSTYGDLNFESFVNHDVTLGGIHKIKSTLGLSIFSRKGEQLNATAYNIPNNSIENADISANLAPGGYLNNAGSFQFEERLLSFFYRAEYRLGTKYNSSFILRRDGSSKFGSQSRYGWFPTISGSWALSEESFYAIRFIDFFKLRLSYGISGNDQIPNFAYRGLLDGEGVYVFNDIITSGTAIGRASNPDLKWETTRQLNFGADLKIRSSIDLTVNYFIKNTKDLLFQPDVSGILGTAGPGSFPPVINAGDVSNKGLEIELGYDSDPSNDLEYGASFNATIINNEVQKTPDGVDFLPGAAFGVGGNIATRFEEGFPIGYFIGYETDGVFQTQAEIDNSAVVQEGAKPGDLRFVDQNGDGVINFSDDSDKKMIGSPLPKITMGLNLRMSFKGFDLSANLFAALGQEIVRNYERQQPFANQLDYTINRWTGTGSTNENPRLTTDLTRNTVFSDYYVEDGSFMRLRNLQLGYTFKKEALKTAKIQSARIYVMANNLITLTNYQGFDPDIGASGGTLSNGIDYGFYPQARTIMTGISITF